MAGPSIVVRVLGDLKGLQQSFGDAGRGAQSASTGIHDAFQGVLGLLNQSGVLGPFASSLSTIDEAFTRLEGHGHQVGQVMLGLGGAFAGVGLGLAVLGSKDQAARQQLSAAIDATGQSWDDYSTRVDQAIKHNERFGDSANQTENALQVLTQATGDPAKALNLLGEATDLAAAKHEDLTTAATQLGKTYNGSTKLLKEFGIAVVSTAGATRSATGAANAAAKADRDLATAKQRLADLETIDASKKKLTVTEAVRLHDAQLKVVTATNTAAAAHAKANITQQAAVAATKAHGTATSQLADKLKGQAAAASDTFTGRLKALTTTVEDQAAAFGQKYGNALQIAGQAVGVLGAAVTGTKGVLDKFRASQELTAAATDTATAAVAAETVALDGEAAAAVAAEAASLPLIATVGLVVLAVAALGAAAYVVYRNWNTIWTGMKRIVVDVWDWIKNNWPYLLGILLGPIALAAAAIYKNWDTLLRFFTSLPGRIASIASGGMWRGIADAFVDAINFVIHVWNGLQFKIPSVGFGPFHTPSFTLGLPDIPDVPHMAQGGLITRDGLVYAHAGEAITPARGSGPAVAIEHAHFSSEVDVEAFMRRAAWVVQTQRV